MAKPSSKAFDWGDATNSQAAMVASASANFVQSMTKATQTYMEGMSALTKELSGFMITRLDHDAEYCQSIAGCEDWAQVVEAQQKWLSQASEEYLAETQKIAELGIRLAANGSTVFAESQAVASTESDN